MDLISELEFRYIRSTGPGGQNVNKVATSVQLYFDIAASSVLSPSVKQRLLVIAKPYIDQDNRLMITARRYRSQEHNRQDAIERFMRLVEKARIPTVKRIRTKPTRSSKIERLDQKRKLSTKKGERKKVREYPD